MGLPYRDEQMIRWLSSQLRGVISLGGYTVNTVFWCIPLFVMTFLKAAVPWRPWRRRCGRILTGIAEMWVWGNNMNQSLVGKTRWRVQGLETLQRRGWYLVLANHQSWVDILVLQRIFHRRIPFLKFFIKRELFWFPLLGQAWWALDFLFIKRYTPSFLKKKPHLKGRDIEITTRACRKFRTMPVSIMNFVEGTRFTREKHRRQNSPYTHLLRAKSGGIAFVLTSMGEQIHRILDVTIVYPGGARSFWEFLCGNIEEIRVRVRSLPVPPDLIGDYANDKNFRKRFHRWLNALWEEKDRCIAEMLAVPCEAAVNQ